MVGAEEESGALNSGSGRKSKLMSEKKSMTKDEYEKNSRRLIGNSIGKVAYHEVDYFDDAFHFFDDPRFDALDYCLEIEFDAGHSVSITWGAEFCSYGVSLIDEAFSTVVSESRVLDVSEIDRWKHLLHKPIESVDVFWSWCEELGKPETRIYYPQDLLIGFDGGQKRVISALEIRVGDHAWGMMDNITVFDGVEMAKRFKCLEEA
jgi:hypothetical protein